jgi:hypothetical protein
LINGERPDKRVYLKIKDVYLNTAIHTTQIYIIGYGVVKTMPVESHHSDWSCIDSWWDSYVQNNEVALVEQELAREVESYWAVEDIQEMDEWWDSYTQVLEEDMSKLRKEFEKANRVWEKGDSVFDTDPLSGGWVSSSGPLRTNREENWSQWLSHLLRSSDDFADELFGDDFDSRLEQVRREVQFQDEDLHSRRVDILLEFRGHGISIEVKKGDENYGKTTQTAELVEKKDARRREWSHFLLLPKHKKRRLKKSFGDSLEDNSGKRPKIHSDNYPDVEVMYWRDITRVLRRVLSSSEVETSEIWEASAYTFINLIEQNICGFYTNSFLQSGKNTLEVPDISGIQSMDSEAQIKYLRNVIMEIKNE